MLPCREGLWTGAERGNNRQGDPWIGRSSLLEVISARHPRRRKSHRPGSAGLATERHPRRGLRPQSSVACCPPPHPRHSPHPDPQAGTAPFHALPAPNKATPAHQARSLLHVGEDCHAVASRSCNKALERRAGASPLVSEQIRTGRCERESNTGIRDPRQADIYMPSRSHPVLERGTAAAGSVSRTVTLRISGIGRSLRQGGVRRVCPPMRPRQPYFGSSGATPIQAAPRFVRLRGVALSQTCCEKQRKC